MTLDSRRAILAAAIALPLAAALASYGLADDADPPEIPAHVRVGESADPSDSPTRSTPGPRPSAPSTTPPVTSGDEPDPGPPPRTEVVPPPPPVTNDNDDDGGGDDSPDDDGDDVGDDD